MHVAVRDPFRLITRFTRRPGALTATSCWPVAEAEWRLSSPGTSWDEVGVNFLVGARNHPPVVAGPILASESLPFDNTELITSSPRGCCSLKRSAAYASHRSGPTPPSREGMEWGTKPKGEEAFGRVGNELASCIYAGTRGEERDGVISLPFRSRVTQKNLTKRSRAG